MDRDRSPRHDWPHRLESTTRTRIWRISRSPRMKSSLVCLFSSCLPSCFWGNTPALHATSPSNRLLLFHPQYRRRAADGETPKVAVATEQVICEIRQIRVLVFFAFVCGPSRATAMGAPFHPGNGAGRQSSDEPSRSRQGAATRPMGPDPCQDAPNPDARGEHRGSGMI